MYVSNGTIYFVVSEKNSGYMVLFMFEKKGNKNDRRKETCGESHGDEAGDEIAADHGNTADDFHVYHIHV